MGKNGRESTFNPKNKYATVKLCLSSLEEKKFKTGYSRSCDALYSLKNDKTVGVKCYNKSLCIIVWGREGYQKSRK